MSAETRSYIVPYEFWSWNGSDAVADGEFQKYGGDNAFATEGLRQFEAPLGSTIEIVMTWITLSANANTVDTAQFVLQLNQADSTIFVTVVDQATGNFIVTGFESRTNRTASVGAQLSNRYDQGDNTASVNTQGIQIRVIV